MTERKRLGMLTAAPGLSRPTRFLRVRDVLNRRLEWGFQRHPVLTLAWVMILTGLGTVAAVVAATVVCALPLGLLMGWN